MSHNVGNQYNHIRPREALGIETPSSIYDFSNRPFPERVPGFEYGANMKIMKVCQNGTVRWKSYHWVYLTTALKGKYVAIEEIGKGIWKVFYRNVFLGFFYEKNIRDKQVSIWLSQNLL